MPCARPAIFAINLASTESQAHRSCIGCGMNWCPVDIAHSPSLRICDVQVYGYGITQRKGKKQKRKTKTRLSVFTFSTYINNCYILFSRSPPCPPPAAPRFDSFTYTLICIAVSCKYSPAHFCCFAPTLLPLQGHHCQDVRLNANISFGFIWVKSPDFFSTTWRRD